MIKNIIFDLGNVIINYNKDNIVNHFTRKDDEKNFLKEKIINSEEWKLLDLGQIDNDEAIERVQKRNDSKYKDLIKEFWHEWYKVQPINEDVVNIAKSLRNNNYNIYVLSNMAIETYEYFKKEEFFSICDGIVISGYEKVKKPDSRIFNILLERYNLNPNECLFIDDDDTFKSFETANKLGIKGRRTIPNNAEDIKKSLMENEIKI